MLKLNTVTSGTNTAKMCPSIWATPDPIRNGWKQWTCQLSSKRTWRENSVSSWKLFFSSCFSVKCYIWSYRGTFFSLSCPKVNGQRLSTKMIQLYTAAGTWKSLSWLRACVRCRGENDIRTIKGKYKCITGTTATTAHWASVIKIS